MSRRTPINHSRADHIQQTQQTNLLQKNANLLSKINEGSSLKPNVLFNNVTLATAAINSTTLDLGDISRSSSVHIFGRCVLGNSNDTFDIMGSNDNTNYFRIRALKPLLESVSGKYHFSHRIRNLTRYVRIQNPNTARTITEFTLNYNHLAN